MRTTTLISLIAAVSALAACDPRDFSDLANKAWVHSDGKPSGSSSTGYAVGLVSAGGSELRYFVASQSPAAVSLVNFDDSGARTLVVDSSQTDTLNIAEQFDKAPVMASDLGGFGGSVGNVAIATFDGTNPALFFVDGKTRVASPAVPLLDSQQALSAIAFGDTSASLAGKIDLVAVAGSVLNLVVDYQSSTAPESCTLPGDASSVAIAKLGEILVAANGKIYIADGLAVKNAAQLMSGANCFDSSIAQNLVSATSEASFGAIIREGDFDGDGNEDLAVAAPEENAVLLFFDWKSTPSPQSVKLATPGNSKRFGAAMAVGDFNGDGRDELLVADPERDVNSHPSAGTVFLFETDSNGTFSEPLQLYDAQPEDDQVFGRAIVVLKAFGGPRLVVGARDEVFTYFRTPVRGDIDFRN